jgi:hypothetical protein
MHDDHRLAIGTLEHGKGIERYGEIAGQPPFGRWCMPNGLRLRRTCGLNAEQWRHGTLCGPWDVEEVVAHLGARSSSNRESMGRQNALRINLPTSYDRASVPTW